MTSYGLNTPSAFGISKREMQNIVVVQNISGQKTLLSMEYLTRPVLYQTH